MKTWKPKKTIMTELLYYQDVYLKETQAKVLAVEGKKVLLDKTVFFPETAGKPKDTGRVDGIPLLGAVKQDRDVWHILASEHKLKAGDTAFLQLDWRRRHYSMRLHAAVHLVSDVFKRHFRIYAASNRLTDSAAYLEFAKEVGIQTIGEALEKSNAIARDGAEINIYVDETAKKRAVKIGTFPEFYCDGLFANNLKEIGLISLESAAMEEGRFILAIRVEDLKTQG